jgi:hypothetical protein
VTSLAAGRYEIQADVTALAHHIAVYPKIFFLCRDKQADEFTLFHVP